MITHEERELLQWDEVLSLYSKHCYTEAGKKHYLDLQPLSTEGAILQTKRISELKSGIIQGITPDFSLIFPVYEFVERASREGMLTLDELYRCAQTLASCNRIGRFFARYNNEFPLVSVKAAEICILENEEKILSESITDNIELNISLYPHIGKLQKEIHSLQNEIKSTLSKLVHSSQYKDHVQETIVTTQGSRYVILIKASSKGKVGGQVVDTSASGATFYFEPTEVSNLNAKLLLKENQLHAEIFKVLKELSASVGRCRDELLSNINTIAYLDFIYSCARASNSFNFNPVSYTDKPIFTLIHARHPLLVASSDVKVVANTVAIGGDEPNGMIITGANTGGKTVLLKSVALLILLARYGLHIPAGADSEVGKFTRVCIDIGDDQNIEKSLSTFSGQIVSVNKMINAASSSSLIIIDEIISGTNPRHAAALATSVLEDFAQKNAKVITSTHYPELKEFATKSNYYENASVSFDIDSLRPTYRLTPGTPGTSYAFEIAKIYDMPAHILKDASRHLTQNEIISEETIERVNRLEVELSEKQENITKLEASLEKQRGNYYELNKKLREKIEAAKEGKTIAYVEQLDKWKKEILDKVNLAIKSCEESGSTTEAYSLIEEIDANKEKAYQRAERFKENRLTGDYQKFDEDMVKVGDKVFLTTLEKSGTIVELFPKKREALVSLGSSFKSRFSYDKLKLGDDYSQNKNEPVKPHYSSAKKSKKRASAEADEQMITLQTEMNTVDLRGMRVDEALQSLEAGLDSLTQSGISAGVVIHGHGTGALKEAVRSWIKNSFYVQNFRPGEQSEGGDGVTIVYL